MYLASKAERESQEFKTFSRQLYHTCLELAYLPLKQYMTTFKVLQCPDGHFRRVIFSIGPYITDYPEQVWLLCVVSNWCPKYAPDCPTFMMTDTKSLRCDAMPNDLGNTNGIHLRTHEKTNLIITQWDPGIIWYEYGIRVDVRVSEMIF
jgi:hypothetical protein